MLPILHPDDIAFVSLFTREWIEIIMLANRSERCLCLPLYEGVDWNTYDAIYRLLNNGLPLYEGVDWNLRTNFPCFWKNASPSLRGSGLKWLGRAVFRCGILSPSLRGSGLKWGDYNTAWSNQFVSLFTREWIEISICWSGRERNNVSLFTREWIEIKIDGLYPPAGTSLPLYEGVDWNRFPTFRKKLRAESPSLRGSGLKSAIVPLQRHEYHRLPLYEGVDWNLCRKFRRLYQIRLPLYEGVDWNWFAPKCW